METKVCVKCIKEKLLNEFYENRNKCKECQNKERYQKKKIDFINKPESLLKHRNWAIGVQRRKEKRCPLANFKQTMRNVLRRSFSRYGFKNTSSSLEVFGISWIDFKEYFESKFKEDMSWENRSAWQIDHIIPISIARNVDDMIKLNHYTNFQPLWRRDNYTKSNKILEEHKGLLHKLLGDDFVIE